MSTDWKPYRGTMTINWNGQEPQRFTKAQYAQIREVLENCLGGEKLWFGRTLVSFHRFDGLIYISATR